MIMEQSITLRIAGKDYSLKANSPEMEQLMRVAAETINKKVAAYDVKFPDKTAADKLAFVALSETVGRLSYQKKLSSMTDEAERMLRETNSYLDSIDKK